MADLTLQKVPGLLREIDEAESDEELQGLYINLGVAYKNGRKFNDSLREAWLHSAMGEE